MRIHRLIMAGLVATLAAGTAAPAFADEWGHRDERGHEWREHERNEQVWREHEWREHEWREHVWRERPGYYAAPVVVTPGYGYYTAPGYYR